MKKLKLSNFDTLSFQSIDEDSDLIPLMTPEDEEEIQNELLPESLPILPLRNTVLFPGVVIPITAGRDASVKLINVANANGKVIGVVSQKDENVEEPTLEDINTIGTVARILRVLKCLMEVTLLFKGKSVLKLMRSLPRSHISLPLLRRFLKPSLIKGVKSFLL